MTDTEDAMDDIERRLSNLEATMRLLLAVKLVDKGHAPNLGEAMALTRDREALDRIFPPEADR